MKTKRIVIYFVAGISLLIQGCFSFTSTNGELKPIRTIIDFKEVNSFNFLEGGKYLSLEGNSQNKSGMFLLEQANDFRKGKFIPIDNCPINSIIKNSFYFIDGNRRLNHYTNEKIIKLTQDPVFAYLIFENEVFFQVVDKKKLTCYISSTKNMNQKIYLNDLDVNEGSDAGEISPGWVSWAPNGSKIIYYPTVWENDEKNSQVDVIVVRYPEGDVSSFKIDLGSTFLWSPNSNLVLNINKSGYSGKLNVIDTSLKKTIKSFTGMYSAAIWKTETKILALKHEQNQNVLILSDYLQNLCQEKWRGSEIPYNLTYSSKNEVVAFNTIGNGSDTLKVIWLDSGKFKTLISQSGYRIAGWDLADNGYLIVRFRNSKGKEIINLYKYI